MKKLLALCIVATVISSVTGCGCCRRVRDFLCRGAYCGSNSVVAAPIPMMAAPPQIVAAPMAYDPGCSYAGMDPGCGYQVGYGGAPSYDSGWSGGQACDSCSGGYAMPAQDGGAYLADPNGSVAPGPAPIGAN